MAFTASLTELAAVAALKAVYSFLRAMPPLERYEAATDIACHPIGAPPIETMAFWMLADEFAEKPLGGRKSLKLAEQLLSILLRNPDLIASIAPAIADFQRPACISSNRDTSDLVSNAVPPSLPPLVARKRTRPSSDHPVNH